MTNEDDKTFVSSITPTLKEIKEEGSNDTFIIVGSDAICDVQLIDPSISPQHIRITLFKRGSFLVKDLGSQVGTFYEGKRISKQIVSAHDTIQIGYKPFLVRELILHLLKKIRKKG
ncbi:MAG: FHA domain-containing protein, partial [Myxococcota bacterium]|nr:FHA domain-containing protein [Myxococcota bacterium]